MLEQAPGGRGNLEPRCPVTQEDLVEERYLRRLAREAMARHKAKRKQICERIEAGARVETGLMRAEFRTSKRLVVLSISSPGELIEPRTD